MNDKIKWIKRNIPHFLNFYSSDINIYTHTQKTRLELILAPWLALFISCCCMILLWSASANKDSDTSSEIKQENMSQNPTVLPLRCVFLSFHRIFILKTVRAVVPALLWHWSSIFSLLKFDLRDPSICKSCFPVLKTDVTSRYDFSMSRVTVIPISSFTWTHIQGDVFPQVKFFPLWIQTIIPLIILQWTIQHRLEFQWLIFLQWRK